MIVVLDTNILISGIFWKYGNPRKIIDEWRAGVIEIAISEDTLEELVTVLKKEFEMNEEDINYWKNLISENSIIVQPSKKHDIIKSHETDNKFIDVAVEADAEYIISGDRHLLEIGSFGKIKIIKANEMIKILKYI